MSNATQTAAAPPAQVLRTGFRILLIALAIFRAWAQRFGAGPDAISYLDIGRALSRGRFSAIFNPYWSPGYPIVLAPVLRLTFESPLRELLAVHALQVVIFMAALWAFERFWMALAGGREADAFPVAAPKAYWALGYSLFAVAALDFIGVSRLGPDLLLCVFIFGAAAILVRAQRQALIPPKMAAGMGIFLGLGYWVKSPFFPVGILICACLITAPGMRLARRKAVILPAAFVVTIAPLVIGISREVGHPSFGEVGRLAWAWYIDGVEPVRHWLGGPASAGAPIHGTQLIFSGPDTFAFDFGSSTYPPWYNPAYFYQGVRVQLLLKPEVIALARNLWHLGEAILRSSGALLAGLLALAWVTGIGRWRQAFLQEWRLWAPCLAAVAMFAMVLLEPRYYAGWMLVVWGAAAASLRVELVSTRRFAKAVLLSAALIVMALEVANAGNDAFGVDTAPGRSRTDLVMAYAVAQAGLRPGDKIAVIGNAITAFWAYASGLQIIAEIPPFLTARPGKHPLLDFWQAEPERRRRVLEALWQTGAKAVIAEDPPVAVSAEWHQLAGTNHYIYWLRSGE